MRIAVVSDTHGHIRNTEQAVSLIRSQAVEAVLHCGDIGSSEIVRLFSDWPTHFVLGNVDGDPREFAAAIEGAGQSYHERFADLTLEGTRIALLHSDDGPRFRRTIQGGEYDLVCYGHTHVAHQERIGRTVVLNPGALYRATPHTFAIVDLPELTITRVTVA
ncbi:MAG: metallophosphoesterase family protein [Planctomycetaceae bacterium]